MTPLGEVRTPPTEEQARALGVTGSGVALSAGAGCGKTFVLAERFIRALEGADPRPLGRVVALTFTNKAARELRERIRKIGRARVLEGGDPLRWRGILRGLEAARIGTFHSFCGDILRRHAIEAGVDPGFVVFDEPIALAVREEALATSLRERLSARDPDLIELAVEYGLGMVRQSLDNFLGNRSRGDLRPWAARQPGELVENWGRIWAGEVRPSMLAAFRERAKPCLDLIASSTFDNEKVRSKLGLLRGLFDGLLDAEDPALVLQSINEAAKVQGLAAKLWPSASVHETFKNHFDAIRADAKKLREALATDDRTTWSAARHGLMFARLASHVGEAYDRAKRARGGVDHDDLLLLTHDLLAHSEAVRDALAGSVDLVLVDEFQDTDPVQAEILEGLAGPGGLEGKLFLVGDFKQSIYRFRGADADLFLRYRDRFPVEGRLALSENFRSVPAILDFVNALFVEEFDGEDSALKPGGLSLPSDGPPAVEFLWAPEDTECPPSSKLDANARRRDEARRLAGHLKARLDEGWIVLDKKTREERRAHQGDVAILFRSLSDSSEYERALVTEGLDFHVVGGSGFYAQQEVLDLINVLTAVDDPLDAVSLAGALRSPFFSLSDDGLYWLATARKGSPHEGLDLCDGPRLERLPEADRPRATRARRLLEDWRAVKDALPIAVLIDRILDDSGYEAALIGEFLGDRKRANARKLVRMARRFDEQGGFTLADFVARLRADLRGATKETQAATTDEEGEIIRLMSIHQAKGLEFPIVVLPDLDRKRPGELKRVAFDPELGPLVNPVAEIIEGEDGQDEESGGSLGWTIHRHREREADDDEALRLFYVATTRARDALVLSSATAPSKKATSPALVLLDRRFDRSTGRFKGDLPDGWREPSIRVVAGTGVLARASAVPSRPRPRLLEVAKLIREGSEESRPGPIATSTRPRFVELDPASGLSSSSARLDRLFRTILADPRALDPARVEAIAVRAARLQDPVSPSRLVEEAIGRVVAWSQSSLGREIARTSEVHRSFPWMIRRTIEGESTLFRGFGDFLYRRPGGELGLVNFSDPASSGAVERLRLRLSAMAAVEIGRGVVHQAWWVRPGEGGKTVAFPEVDEPSIDRAVLEFFESLDSPISGP